LAWWALSSPLENDYSPLGKAVRHLRKYAGLSQEELAHKSDIHHTWISHIEQGRVNASHKTMESIAAGIGVDHWQILSLAKAYTEIDETLKD
jgi:transcriptional regulator with XRE-family HTH domain